MIVQICTPIEKTRVYCDSGKTVMDVIKAAYIPVEDLLRFCNTIMVDGQFMSVAECEELKLTNAHQYTASGKKRSYQRVFISVFPKCGEIWKQDPDGIYRYKGEYV